MIAGLGWIFLAVAGAGSGGPFVSAQAYAHHMQAVWAELEGDASRARENVALARLYDERSPSLARAEARLTFRAGLPLRDPLPPGGPLLGLWRAAAAGDWEQLRRGLARRAGRGAATLDEVELVAALAAAGQREDAARLAEGWAGPDRRLPAPWWDLLDADGWRAWAAVDDREEVAAAALEARWRAGAWAEVESAARERLRVHPGSIARIDQALRWAGAFDPGLARRLVERWRWLDPAAGEARARALLAAGWAAWVSPSGLEPATRIRVDLAVGRLAGAAARWRPDMPDELGLALARALARAELRSAALSVLAAVDGDPVFVLRARLLASEPERLRALLATATPRPERWGAWALVGAEMPAAWSEADRVRAAWSARGDAPPGRDLVEAMLEVAPDHPEVLAWMAVYRGGAWIDRARRHEPADPRVLEAELRWTAKPERWVEWALRRHPRDARLAAVGAPAVGPRAEASEP